MGASGSRKRPNSVFTQFDLDQDGFLSPTEVNSLITKASKTKKIATDLGLSQDRLLKILEVFKRVKDPPGISGYQFCFFLQPKTFKVGLFGPHGSGKTTIIEEFAPKKVEDDTGENLVASRLVDLGNQIQFKFQITHWTGDQGIGPGSFGCGRRSDAWVGLDAAVVVYDSCKLTGFYDTTDTLMKDTINFTEPSAVKALCGTKLDRKATLHPAKVVPRHGVQALARDYMEKHPKEIKSLECFETGKKLGDSAEKIFLSLAALWLAQFLGELEANKDPSVATWRRLIPFSGKELVYLALLNSPDMGHRFVWWSIQSADSALSVLPQEIRVKIFQLFLDAGRGQIAPSPTIPSKHPFLCEPMDDVSKAHPT